MHETDTVLAQRDRRHREGDLGPLDPKLSAGIGIVEARQYLDQCRLAGAVLAEQPVNFAAADRQLAPIQRAYASEIFREVGDAQDRRRITALVLGVCGLRYRLHGLRAPALPDGATIARFMSSAPRLWRAILTRRACRASPSAKLARPAGQHQFVIPGWFRYSERKLRIVVLAMHTGTSNPMLAVDEDRVLADLRTLAEFGKQGTGVSRPAFSDADLKARRWLADQMKAAGLDAVIDGIGTVYGRSPDAGQSILVGSHSDSVPK